MQIADIYAMLILKNINDTVEKLIQEDKALTDGNLNLYSIRLALHQNFAEFFIRVSFYTIEKNIYLCTSKESFDSIALQTAGFRTFDIPLPPLTEARLRVYLSNDGIKPLRIQNRNNSLIYETRD